MSRRRNRIDVLLFDIHGRHRDVVAWTAAMRLLGRLRPDGLVFGGDLEDWESVSHHGNGPEIRQLRDDVKVVRDLLKEASEAAGRPKDVWVLEGNHEAWLRQYLLSHAPSLYTSLSLPDLLDVEKRRWRWVPETEQPVQVGGAMVLHGHQIMGKFPPVYFSRKLAEQISRDGMPAVCGHTHQTQSWTGHVAGRLARGYGVGCLAKLHREWRRGAPIPWSHSVGVVVTAPNGEADVIVPSLKGGEFNLP